MQAKGSLGSIGARFALPLCIVLDVEGDMPRPLRTDFMRQKLVVGNWKMHGSSQFVQGLLKDLIARSREFTDGTEVAVCPTDIHLSIAAEQLAGSDISLGAQDAYPEESGAFTGEVAAAMLPEFGVKFVIVGHSERRRLFGDTDSLVARKFAAVQAYKMQPILCLGETLEQRERGDTKEVVLGQLAAVIAKNGIQALSSAVLAYEPVWAIGTGKTATPEQAQEVHLQLRQYVAEVQNGENGQKERVAQNLRILYGGSVNAGNAAELFAQNDIDGGLVGGASLQADEFIAICKAG